MPHRVEGSIEIEAPVEAVYAYWETLENLPNFMINVEEVTPTGPDTTRWRVKGPLGRTLEWEARTTIREPNSAIGWTANVGADVDNAGVVRFRARSRRPLSGLPRRPSPRIGLRPYGPESGRRRRRRLGRHSPSGCCGSPATARWRARTPRSSSRA